MLLIDVAYGLSGLIGLGIIFIGARFLVAPKVAEAGFGVLVDKDGRGADAYLTTKGVRDIVSGLFMSILLASGVPHILGWIMLAVTLIPIGDAIKMLRHDGPKLTAYGVHGGTPLVMLATAALLLMGPA